MISTTTYPIEANLPNTAKVCSACKTDMRVTHCLQENGSFFVWLKCTENNCSGQMLLRLSATDLADKAARASTRQSGG